MDLKERIAALRAAGAVSVRVSPDGTVSGSFVNDSGFVLSGNTRVGGPHPWSCICRQCKARERCRLQPDNCKAGDCPEHGIFKGSIAARFLDEVEHGETCLCFECLELVHALQDRIEALEAAQPEVTDCYGNREGSPEYQSRACGESGPCPKHG